MILKNKFFSKDYNSEIFVYEHETTRCEIVWIKNAHENKVFSIGFSTPIKNSSGISHILEHIAMSSSKKFSSKDITQDLLNFSVCDDINGTTLNDTTMYYFATKQSKDFFNLAETLLSGIFEPNLDEMFFMREGWHIDFSKTPVFSGTVFNEVLTKKFTIKSQMWRGIMSNCFKGTQYEHDQGGNPLSIVSLTNDDIQKYHYEFYHPSNAKIVICGDIDISNLAQILDTQLAKFTSKELMQINSSDVTFTNSTNTQKYQSTEHFNENVVSFNWSIGRQSNSETLMGHIISAALVRSGYSPLRGMKLSSEKSSLGFQTDYISDFFNINVFNPNSYSITDIFSELKSILSRPFLADHLEASIKRTIWRFQSQKHVTSRFYIDTATQLVQNMLHQKDICRVLEFESTVEEFQKEYTQNPYLIDEYMHKKLVENQNLAVVKFEPDETVSQQFNQQLNIELNNIIFSNPKLENKFKNYQVWLNKDLSDESIPRFKFKDFVPILTKNITQLEKDPKVYFVNIDDPNLVFLNIGFDLSVIPDYLFQYIYLWGQLVRKLDTNHLQQNQITNFIDKNLLTWGAISIFRNELFKETTHEVFFLKTAFEVYMAKDILNLIADLLTGIRFDNKKRVLDIVLKEIVNFNYIV